MKGGGRGGVAGSPARGLTSGRPTHFWSRVAWPAQTHLSLLSLSQAAEAARPGLGRPVSAASPRETALGFQSPRPPARPATAPPPRHWLPAASILPPPLPLVAVLPFRPPRPGDAAYQDGEGRGKMLSGRFLLSFPRPLHKKKGRGTTDPGMPRGRCLRPRPWLSNRRGGWEW